MTETKFDIARTYEEVLECWQLVYRCYVRKGLIAANPRGIHTVKQTRHADTLVVFGQAFDKVYTTLTVIPDGDFGLPLDIVYADLLNQMRHSGQHLIEVGMLADDRAVMGKESMYAFETMCIAASYAQTQQADVIIGVHPHHVNFYVRMMGFVMVGEQKLYPSVNNLPVIPLLLNKDWINMIRTPKVLRRAKSHPTGLDMFDKRFDLSKVPSHESITRAVASSTALETGKAVSELEAKLAQPGKHPNVTLAD